MARHDDSYDVIQARILGTNQANRIGVNVKVAGKLAFFFFSPY